MTNASVMREKRMPLRRKVFIIICLCVPLLHFAVFYMGVNFNALLLAFKSSSLTGPRFSLENFKMVLDEFNNPYADLKSSFVNTFIFFGVNIFINIPLCFAISFFFYKKIWGYNTFRYVFFLPSVISSVVVTACFKYSMAPDGPIHLLLGNFTQPAPLLLNDSRYALKTILFFNVWSSFGVGLILYTAAFNRIPVTVLEAGLLDGLGFWKEIRYIIIPLTWPFLSTMLLLAFCGIFSAGGPILLFTKGAYGTYTLSYWIFEKTTDGANINIAAALGMLLTIIALPIVFLFRMLAGKVEVYEY